MVKIILASSILFLFACTGPGASSGFAPGAIVTVPASSPTTTATSSVKYGETKTLSNGWQVSNDNSDPVEQQTLSNGWNVEVKYE
ncbi:hypothetical protein CIK05_11525 [Bdellovibrio sp. qaytius]|nr:hypothetical protein CIK05_11525 [Bdellovibrio sp. qaytius]